jgi:predicted TIM-barrel fold metal-dependent hydrolase
MKYFLTLLFLIFFTAPGSSQIRIRSSPSPGYEERIKEYIDTLRIVDTHEHLADPSLVKKSNMLDFFLLLHHYYYDDLVSSGLPDSIFNLLFNKPLKPKEKWRLIEPYWKNSFNTGFNRVALLASKHLFGIGDINESTVDALSANIIRAYDGNWYNHVLKELCRIDYIIEDGDYLRMKNDYIKYAKRFTSWLSVRSKHRIDSLATKQVDPIFTLEDFVKSMRVTFENAVTNGMVAVKINEAYNRTLSFDNVKTDAVRKIFRGLVSGNEDHFISQANAKPLQDYMFRQLMDLAKEYKMPVVFHTGLQAGKGNMINNSNPTLLANIFKEYPEINFALFHGSYPFGGELSTLAKTYKNVYIDMNWTYAISPSYSERYLNEWLETVPASKIMAFGGDYTNVENIYGELLIARQVITNVLVSKVRDSYFTEAEAKTVAKMILYDNAMKFYKLPEKSD